VYNNKRSSNLHYLYEVYYAWDEIIYLKFHVLLLYNVMIRIRSTNPKKLTFMEVKTFKFDDGD
jgi:hypothetical protein